MDLQINNLLVLGTRVVRVPFRWVGGKVEREGLKA